MKNKIKTSLRILHDGDFLGLYKSFEGEEHQVARESSKTKLIHRLLNIIGNLDAKEVQDENA